MSEAELPSEPTVPRDASSLVILRGTVDMPQVLLGKRRDTARFMPGYYVFPGGAVDPVDILLGNDPAWAGTRFHAAALRETWEETGATLAGPGPAAIPFPADTAGDPFLGELDAEGMIPKPEALQYIARAITPAESRIRFDTRFFLGTADYLFGTPRAIGELPDVQWVAAAAALSSSNLSGVTKFVLGEALSLWQQGERLTALDRPVRSYTYIEGARRIAMEPQSDGLR